MTRRLLRIAVLLAIALSSGCMKTAGNRSTVESIVAMPLVPGTTWTYSEVGLVESDQVTVHYRVLEPMKLEGHNVIGVLSTQANSVPETEFYEVQQDVVVLVAKSLGTNPTDHVQWFSETSRMPIKIQLGQEWNDGSDRFRVVRKADVQVPAGRFSAYVVELTVDNKYTDTLYFADGVGLVKEEGLNARELLDWKPAR